MKSKMKSLIFRTLVFSLYPEKFTSDCFLSTEGGVLILKTGSLAKRLRISTDRMKDQLRDLEALGLIYDLQIDRFVSKYKVTTPSIFVGNLYRETSGE